MLPSQAMAASGLNVIIPKPIPELTRTRVCVMEFCEGMKLTDPKVLAKIPNKEALMRVVCESFAYQMHIDGLFNADPHPGNILVQINSKDGAPPVATPVLLVFRGRAEGTGPSVRMFSSPPSQTGIVDGGGWVIDGC